MKAISCHKFWKWCQQFLGNLFSIFCCLICNRSVRFDDISGNYANYPCVSNDSCKKKMVPILTIITFHSWYIGKYHTHIFKWNTFEQDNKIGQNTEKYYIKPSNLVLNKPTDKDKMSHNVLIFVVRIPVLYMERWFLYWNRTWVDRWFYPSGPFY